MMDSDAIETFRKMRGPVIAGLAALVLNVISNLLAQWFPELVKQAPILAWVPWVAIAACWILLGYVFMKFRGLIKWDGVESATGLQRYVRVLAKSGFHPKEYMEKITQFLDFMGHGASKWTKERELLVEMLNRTYSNNGQVRMLLLDPRCAPCIEASRAYHSDDHYYARKITASLMVLNEMRRSYPHLHVRLYTHKPEFRLTFDDRDSVTVGHYMGYRRGSAESPLLLFSKRADWSYYVAYLTYFEDEWDRAADVDWEALRTLSTRLASPDVATIPQLSPVTVAPVTHATPVVAPVGHREAEAAVASPEANVGIASEGGT